MNVSAAEFLPSSLNHLTLSTRLVAELGDARSTLRATTQRSGSSVMVYAGGEVDACNENTWRRLLDEAAAAVSPPGPLVVDTNGLDFIGCCAFSVLAEEARRCRDRGVELRLVSLQPVVARTVVACGLTGLLPVDQSVDAALSAVAVPE
jgi:anti-anti-sigma factor